MSFSENLDFENSLIFCHVFFSDSLKVDVFKMLAFLKVNILVNFRIFGKVKLL